MIKPAPDIGRGDRADHVRDQQNPPHDAAAAEFAVERECCAEAEHEGEQGRKHGPDERVPSGFVEAVHAQDTLVIAQTNENLVFECEIGWRVEERQINRVIDRVGNHQQHHQERGGDVEIIGAMPDNTAQQAWTGLNFISQG